MISRRDWATEMISLKYPRQMISTGRKIMWKPIYLWKSDGNINTHGKSDLGFTMRSRKISTASILNSPVTKHADFLLLWHSNTLFWGLVWKHHTEEQWHSHKDVKLAKGGTAFCGQGGVLVGNETLSCFTFSQNVRISVALDYNWEALCY